MLISIAAYFLSLSAVLVIKHFCALKTQDMPKIEWANGAVKFVSHARHKIFVGECVMLFVNNAVHLKREDKHITIVNVIKPKLFKGYLYFTACGEVKIAIKNAKWYRYLQIDICSNAFNIGNLKRQAELEVLNNLFNIRACVSLKRYLRFVKNVLKVELVGAGVKVTQNAYKLPFSIGYNCCGKEKRVLFNQTV